MNVNFESIGKAFIEHYYKTFDTNRVGLKALYREDSLLTFEGAQLQGADAIVAKLQSRAEGNELGVLLSRTASWCELMEKYKKSLPFQTVQHIVTHGDCQPSADYGVLVHVIGQLKTDNDQPLGFSQTFFLKQIPMNTANFYVANDIFRLALHHG